MNDLEATQIPQIIECNEFRRKNLIELASALDSDRAKAEFIVGYFTNKLPKETIAKIDGVNENNIKPFSYDYSFIKGNEGFNARKQKSVFFTYSGGYVSGKTIMSTGNDLNVDGKPKIFPSLFALKMGTCTMFAHEMKRLMCALEIPCDLIETEGIDCYDFYNGNDEHNEYTIHTNSIKKMRHAYNIIRLNNEPPLKVDIAGFLTAIDFNQNHPMGRENQINQDDFCLSPNINENPFQGADNPTL